jgi:hypothetical protein
MPRQRRVLVWGSSLFIAAVAESLRAAPPPGVSRIEAHSADQPLDVLTAAGDVVLCDLPSVPPDAVVALLRAHAGLAIIGLDIDSDQVVVLSGKRRQAYSARDLAAIIGDNAREACDHP